MTNEISKAQRSRNAIIDLLVERTEAAAKSVEIANSYKEVRPTLSEKGQKLQALIDDVGFGCQTKTVASALSILTGEDIREYEKPGMYTTEMQIPGVCFIETDERKRVVCVTDESSRWNCARAISNARDGRRPTHSLPGRTHITFATKEQITKAVGKLSDAVAGIWVEKFL